MLDNFCIWLHPVICWHGLIHCVHLLFRHISFLMLVLSQTFSKDDIFEMVIFLLLVKIGWPSFQTSSTKHLAFSLFVVDSSICSACASFFDKMP